MGRRASSKRARSIQLNSIVTRLDYYVINAWVLSTLSIAAAVTVRVPPSQRERRRLEDESDRSETMSYKPFDL